MITNIVKRIYREIKNAEELENQRKELEEKSEKRNREVKASVWLVESKARSNKEWTKIYIDKKHKKNSETVQKLLTSSDIRTIIKLQSSEMR